MLYWLSFLFPRVIESRWSEFNGQIEILQFMGGIQIRAGGLTQSGGLVNKIWRGVFDYLSEELPGVKRPKVLILGFGAGSLVAPIRERWHEAMITGVDIDREMVRIGEDYFGITSGENLRIEIGDVFEWAEREKSEYDLVIVDLFIGKNIPRRLYKDKFISQIYTLLADKGVAVFNHALAEKQMDAANKLESLLTRQFNQLNRIKTVANRLILVKK